MNKAQLIESVAKESNLKKKDVELAIKTTLDVIEATLKAGEKVQLVGFGTFEVRNRKERQGRNPSTKETITIPASKQPAFTAGKALKDSVNS